RAADDAIRRYTNPRRSGGNDKSQDGILARREPGARRGDPRQDVRCDERRRKRQDLRFWQLRGSRQARARGTQSQDGCGSADHSAPRPDVSRQPETEGQDNPRGMTQDARQIRFHDGKEPDALRTIGEVASAFDIKQHILRYWEQQFPMLRPLKRSGGRRYYRPEDVALVQTIDRL